MPSYPYHSVVGVIPAHWRHRNSQIRANEAGLRDSRRRGWSVDTLRYSPMHLWLPPGIDPTVFFSLESHRDVPGALVAEGAGRMRSYFGDFVGVR